MALTVVITGASGFLGQALLEAVATGWPNATIIPVHSPRRGGMDLAQSGASEQLRRVIHIVHPCDTVLIHAAAVVEWQGPEGFLANAAMALNVATWARSVDISFCVLVSSVNACVRPITMYGLGKWTAEQLWCMLLAPERRVIVRLAGVWGWQQRPTLFWNRLLLAAARGSPPEPRARVSCRQGYRNYVSVHEASRCLLQTGINRMPGEFLCAGRDVVDTQSFVEALQGLPESRLSVDWQDEARTDKCIYQPSIEFLPWLSHFPDMLTTMWTHRPNWVRQRT